MGRGFNAWKRCISQKGQRCAGMYACVCETPQRGEAGEAVVAILLPVLQTLVATVVLALDGIILLSYPKVVQQEMEPMQVLHQAYTEEMVGDQVSQDQALVATMMIATQDRMLLTLELIILNTHNQETEAYLDQPLKVMMQAE